jgi:signal transduction histidine kinase
MARHFLWLYLLIILTLAIVSWGQDQLLQAYSSPDSVYEKSIAVAVVAVADRLRETPPDSWKAHLASIGTQTGTDIEVFATGEIAGADTLERLNRGENAYMRSGAGDAWILRRIDAGHVLALKAPELPGQRGPLEWGLTIGFYALIALVLMIWIWPLTRDLGALEKAAAQYGNRNWRFTANIKPRSQIYPLAATFHKMAARIDGLIASHTDMSNAVSHEIKTPLSRMQFEIELAQQSDEVSALKASLIHIKTDIEAINGLVKATLGYAILERADFTPNLAEHDFTSLIPAIIESVKQDLRPGVAITGQVGSDASRVVCDLHLFERVLRNLLYNAGRYAATRIGVTFTSHDGMNELIVEDDGPGIPAQERIRVFQSFVQLDPVPGKKVGYGLGLAIVKRAIEWHGGEVHIAESPLGGALVSAKWPAIPGAPR